MSMVSGGAKRRGRRDPGEHEPQRIPLKRPRGAAICSLFVPRATREGTARETTGCKSAANAASAGMLGFGPGAPQPCREILLQIALQMQQTGESRGSIDGCDPP